MRIHTLSFEEGDGAPFVDAEVRLLLAADP